MYAGDRNDIEAVKKFFLDMYIREAERIYAHFTCATDTTNIKFVFEAVESTIMENNMSEYHLA